MNNTIDIDEERTLFSGRTLEVGNIPAPKQYKDHYFLDMLIYAEPVGVDPLTKNKVYWGEGSELACLLCDNPQLPENMPF